MPHHFSKCGDEAKLDEVKLAKMSSPLDLSTPKSPVQTDAEIEKTSDSDTRTIARNLSGKNIMNFNLESIIQ